MPSSTGPVDATAPHRATLHKAKLELRRQVLAARDAMSPEERVRAAGEIIARIAALPAYDAARTVLLTLAFRTEWNTTALVRAALLAGKTVAVPRVDVATRMLVLHGIADPDLDVAAGHQGIPEPLPHCPVIAPGAIDWVLVPGVAFDRAGRRLGYGGGFYDRLLPLLTRASRRVAGAFDVQIVHRVPAAPHDLCVDTIVTDSRLLEASS
jgi:5-formyltetrahydrofolate cyclo-ligase